MKRMLLPLMALLAMSLTFQAQNEPTLKGSYLCSMRKSQLPALPDLNISRSGPLHSFDVLEYRLDLDIYSCCTNPYPNSFDGTAIIQFRVDSTLNSITLDANSTSLVINSVSLAGTSFSHSNNLLVISLNQTYVPGDTVEVAISYHHNDVTDNAFYSSGGFVFTDCEPEGARKWFPCWDKPSDKARLDLTAKVPSNVKLGSNGVLADSTLLGDSLWYHWVSDFNIATYIMVMSAKVNYLLDIVYWPTLSNPDDSIPIRFYYNDGEDPSAIEEMIVPMCDWYSTYFCEHPFMKNGFATLNSEFTWGGMENQTLTSLCPGCWSEGLVAHEFTHQWFGDMITCATWADIFLNEGFATWGEAFWYESYAGYSAYKADIDGNASYYLNNNPGWAISEPEWAVNTPPANIMFNYAITYTKASTILHMLRYVVGDEHFFDILSAYANDPELKYHSAVIPDFIEIVNEVTGQDYNWFFDQWIYEPNHPVYQNSYNFQNLGNGQWQVNFYTEQVQADPDFFKMPIELKIRFADYSDTIISVMNDMNYQSFSWVFNVQPVYFQFDPGNQIVIKQSSTFLGIPESGTDEAVHLFQNIPNPANTITSIGFQLDQPMSTELFITDIMGNRVKTLDQGLKQDGKHTVQVDCSDLPAGFYSYTLIANEDRITRKLIITR